MHPCGGGFNTSTAALRGDINGTQCPGVQLGHPVAGGYKYWDLALQVGGVSDETVKYDREFCGTSAEERLVWQGPEQLYSKLQTRLLIREGATK
jgi:hypothetical protein